VPSWVEKGKRMRKYAGTKKKEVREQEKRGIQLKTVGKNQQKIQ
jgi:hypothetical protein